MASLIRPLVRRPLGHVIVSAAKIYTKIFEDSLVAGIERAVRVAHMDAH